MERKKCVLAHYGFSFLSCSPAPPPTTPNEASGIRKQQQQKMWNIRSADDFEMRLWGHVRCSTSARKGTSAQRCVCLLFSTDTTALLYWCLFSLLLVVGVQKRKRKTCMCVVSECARNVMYSTSRPSFVLSFIVPPKRTPNLLHVHTLSLRCVCVLVCGERKGGIQ